MTSELLPDVRPPDDREADLAVAPGRWLLAHRRHLGELGDHPVEQVARAEPLGGRDRRRLAEAEAVELCGHGHGAHVVDLVGGNDRRRARLRAAAQLLGQLLITGVEAAAGIDHQDHEVGVGDGLAGLALHGTREVVLLGHVDAAGVDQQERAPVPVGLDLLAITGHAGLLVDDGLAPAGQPVDQGRLPDVGVADDGDARQAGRARWFGFGPRLESLGRLGLGVSHGRPA